MEGCENWKPAFVVDAKERENPIFDGNHPSARVIFEGLSNIVLGKTPRICAELFVEDENRLEKLCRIVGFDNPYSLLEDGYHHVTIAVPSVDKVQQIILFLQAKVVKKAIFKVEGYELDLVFEFNYQWGIFQRTFDFFAGEFRIGELTVRFSSGLEQEEEVPPSWIISFGGDTSSVFERSAVPDAAFRLLKEKGVELPDERQMRALIE